MNDEELIAQEPPPWLEPPWPYRIVPFDGDFLGAEPVELVGEDEG